MTIHNESKRRHWWGARAWLPWSPFTDSATDNRRRAAAGPLTPAHGRHAALLTLTTALVVTTAVLSLALPQMSLLVEIIGGLLVSVVVLIGTNRIGDVPVALRELRVTIEEGAERSSFASQMYLLRLGLLDLLLRVQARRAEARQANALPEETPDAHYSRRSTVPHPTSRRDLGVHVHGRQNGHDGRCHQHDEPGRSRGLGNGLRTSAVARRWIPRSQSDNNGSVRLQAPAPALASPSTSTHRPDTPRADASPPVLFPPVSAGGVDQRPRRVRRRGKMSSTTPLTPAAPAPPASPPVRESLALRQASEGGPR